MLPDALRVFDVRRLRPSLLTTAEKTIGRLAAQLAVAQARNRWFDRTLGATRVELAEARAALIAPRDPDVDQLVAAVGALVARTTAIKDDPPHHDQGAHMVALEYGLWRGVVDAHDQLRLRRQREATDV